MEQLDQLGARAPELEAPPKGSEASIAMETGFEIYWLFIPNIPLLPTQSSSREWTVCGTLEMRGMAKSRGRARIPGNFVELPSNRWISVRDRKDTTGNDAVLDPIHFITIHYIIFQY